MLLTHKFSVLKSSWGISIDLIAEDSINNKMKGFKVDGRISLDIKLSFGINEEEWSYLIKAIKKMSYAIHQKLDPGQEILITITGIQFSETDYQEEGLYCAMVGWLAKRYNIEPPVVDISFDKLKNKYLFDIE